MGGTAPVYAPPAAVSDNDYWHITLPTASNGACPPTVNSSLFPYDTVQKSWLVEIPHNAIANPLRIELELTDRGVGLMQASRLDVEACIVPTAAAAPWAAEYVAAVSGQTVSRMPFVLSWPRTPGIPHALRLRLVVRNHADLGPIPPSAAGELDSAQVPAQFPQFATSLVAPGAGWATRPARESGHGGGCC